MWVAPCDSHVHVPSSEALILLGPLITGRLGNSRNKKHCIHYYIFIPTYLNTDEMFMIISVNANVPGVVFDDEKMKLQQDDLSLAADILSLDNSRV